MKISNANKLWKTLPVWVALCFISCNESKTRFSLLNAASTHIDFINRIEDSDSLSILDYLYFYNGGGVAVGDVNNDGLPDIYFSSNRFSNKLYINKGNLTFEDVTGKAGVAGKGNWKTGVTIVDVNGDGLQDIYVCEVGKYKKFTGKNELFINNGNGTFTEKAKEYGLDIEGFNTQSVFFDYDRDGDLDMFLVNHSVHSTDSYVRSSARMEKNAVSGDKLFRNDSPVGGGKGDVHFVEVTEQAHIYSSIIGYGLNAVVGDLNNDGWEDIYVSNDFHENDYYYLNQQNGTFAEINATAFGHESRFSMGSDIADINNDGWLDIITLDMLAPDEKINKSSVGEDAQEIYDFKLSYGFHYQYARNCLQLNTGNGKQFSDIALYAGVAATDWSWSPLAADFDNDGIKDLFITNGIPRRPNDLDYLKYVSANYYNTARPGVADAEAIKNMPDGKQRNYMYQGSDSLKFKDVSNEWGFEQQSYSNGAAYADLDNDGDLDLIVNNINEPAFIYRNTTADQKQHHFLQVEVKGSANNRFAVGAKIILRYNGNVQLDYIKTTKGFESSSLQYSHFGLGETTVVDTVQVIWPDGRIVTQYKVKADQKISISYPQQATTTASLLPVETGKLFTEITDSTGVSFIHRENRYNDFSLQPLLIHALSTEGPALAVADVNGDGLEDFFAGGAKEQTASLYIQTSAGKFIATKQLFLEADSMCEDVYAVFFDADNDKDADLYVVSGGNETEAQIPAIADRLYINDGNGNFTKSIAFPNVYGNKSVAAPADFDKDGDIDLFVGGRCIAGRYGVIPNSYLLVNDGKGKFTLADTNSTLGIPSGDGGRGKAGLITGAVWTDIDHDGWPDLIVAGEWMPVTLYKNNKGKLQPTAITANGLWTTLHKADINNDGFEDILAGNWGENSKLHASEQFPLKLFIGDFDNNGIADQVLATEEKGQYYPFLGKEELEKRMPGLIRRKYTTYSSFAGQTIMQVFDTKQAVEYNAAILSSVLLLNNQKGGFTISRLPAAAQWSSIHSFATADFNGDGKPDILSGGNFYVAIPYEGRYDAAAVNVLLQTNPSSFSSLPIAQTGLQINGQVRAIQPIHLSNNKLAYLFALNNDKLLIATQIK